MTQNYLLSDGLTRIRNAQMARAKSTVLLYSKLVSDLLDILIDEGYLLKKEKFEERKGIEKIRVYLKYTPNPTMSEISTISKPGKRVYKQVNKIESMKGGLGITILSTSRGVITDHEAKKLRVGGEVLCQIF